MARSWSPSSVNPMAAVEDVAAPALAGAQPGEQVVLERGELEEVVLGVADHRCGAADPAARLDQVLGVELASAVVALVAAGLGVAAVRAGPLDVAVGQEPTRLRVEELPGDLPVDVAVVAQLPEHVPGDLAVVLGAGGGVQVPRDVELLPVVEELGVVPVDDDLGVDALLVGPNGYRRPVHVRAGHHQHVVAQGAVVAGEDVGRDVDPGHVAQMARPAGVRPGDGDEDLAGQSALRIRERRWYRGRP